MYQIATSSATFAGPGFPTRMTSYDVASSKYNSSSPRVGMSFTHQTRLTNTLDDVAGNISMSLSPGKMRRIIHSSIALSMTSGFVLGLGGFITLPVSAPMAFVTVEAGRYCSPRHQHAIRALDS